MHRLPPIFLVAALVTALAGSAAAGEPSGSDDYADLGVLTAELHAEIGFLSEPADAMPLPGADYAARMQGKILRMDWFLGAVRSRAHDTLHGVLPADVVEWVEAVGPDTSEEEAAAALQASTLPSTSVWAAQRVLAGWIEFQVEVRKLRELVTPLAPRRVCPVDGPTFFRDEWEFPRPGGRVHMGTDLHAERGTPLVAVEDGVVVQANWHRQGGRQVWFRADSTGDVYYYAHLDGWPRWLWTGTRLNAGDFLGWAGSSGNATTPHLHFGWMPAADDVDLDNLENPYDLLYELCE